MIDKIISGFDDRKTTLSTGTGKHREQFVDHLSRNVIGQQDAKNALVDAIFMNINSIVSKTGPLGTFMFAGPSGVGKAQPLDSLILGENGWLKMGDINIGDRIFGEDGKLHKILGVFPQGNKDIYEVVFSDGSSTRCCGEHLWTVQNINDREKGKIQVLSLNNIKDKLLAQGRLNYSIDMIEPVHFSKKDLPLDPYLLGVYLGDGSSHRNISISNSEEDIISKIEGSLPENDTISICNDKRSKAKTITIKRKYRNNEVSDTLDIIRQLGLYGKRSFEKFIPHEYMYSSLSDRVGLLNGLLDTDGYVMKGRGGYSCIEFTTSSPTLSKDFEFLVKSLGGKIKTTVRKSGYKKNGILIRCMDSFRSNCTFPNSIEPVSSKKHTSRYKPAVGKFRKFIQSVKLIGTENCQCIMTDNPSHLYVTDDFIVTHNTQMAMALAHSLLGNPNRLTIINCESLSESHTTAKLSGAPPGYIGYGDAPLLGPEIYLPWEEAKNEGTLSPVIRNFPNFNIVLFDEIEKAHPKVHQSLLGVLDKGIMKMSKGEPLDFSNSIIIMTTNIGEREKRDIREKKSIGFVKSDDSSDLKKSFDQAMKMFSPEFVGRIDDIIHFDNLTEEDCAKIIGIKMDKMNAILESVSSNMNTTRIVLKLTRPVIKYLVAKGYNLNTGARDLNRVFDREINAGFGEVLMTNDEILQYPNFKITVYAEMKDGKVVFTISRKGVEDITDEVKSKTIKLLK